MINVRFEGNRLFFNEKEVRESGTGEVTDTPAHYQPIVCVGISPGYLRIISLETGGRLKMWNPGGPRLGQRVWTASTPLEATALGVTDNGLWVAIAVGLTARIYEAVQTHGSRLIQEITLQSLKDKVVKLEFANHNLLYCRDSEGTEVFVTP